MLASTLKIINLPPGSVNHRMARGLTAIAAQNGLVPIAHNA
jgi:hypothetical protein